MNDEQSKRLADAADALMTAADALDEARDATMDPRFDRDLERERLAAAQQMGQRIDNAGKRIEEAVRKGTAASAAAGRGGAWIRHRTATASAREGRMLARQAMEADGITNKRAGADDAVMKLEEALAMAAIIVFGDEGGR
jgi:hypothetical protein